MLRAGIVCGLLLPAMVQAQDCTSNRISSFTTYGQGTANEVTLVTEADLTCPGGRRLIADQATISKATGIINLMGNVRYSDGRRTMTTNRADYFRADQKVIAYENTTIRDQETGSQIRGQRIEYTPARGNRQAYMMAFPAQPRPRATMVEQADTTTVEADQIELFGENRFKGTGNAQIVRDTLRGFGAIVEFDQQSGALQLALQARIDGTEYDLNGDTINAVISGDTLREVNARGAGVLQTKTVLVEAPTIRISLTAGQVDRMIAALRSEPLPGVPNAQPRVTSEDFRLTADSIDVLAPRQELESVTAVGSAYGEVQDTAAPPAGAAELQGLIDTDWMRGDTVQAFFIANPRAVADTTADSRVLERVVTAGAPASALYRRREVQTSPTEVTPDSAAAPQQYEIGYLLARRIEVVMAEGEVKDIQASEDVRGMYLEPRAAAQVGRGGTRR